VGAQGWLRPVHIYNSVAGAENKLARDLRWINDRIVAYFGVSRIVISSCVIGLKFILSAKIIEMI
jgi:hypothetical protein